MINIFNKIKKNGVKLPPCPKAIAAYVPAIRIHDTIYVSGQLPISEKPMPTGSVSIDISPEEAQTAAGTCFLNALSAALSLISETEDLQLVQMQGFVQCPSNFQEIPFIINGASELAIHIMEDKGLHARTAVGVSSLPKNAPVEITCTFNVLNTSVPNYNGRYEWLEKSKE